MKRTMLLLALVLPGASSARAQDVRVFGRSELQFNTTSVQDVPEVPAATELELRRLRLGAEADVSEWVKAYLQVGFGDGRVRVEDGYGDVRLVGGLRTRAGQFKKPFSPLALYGSPRLLTIERAVRIRGLEEVVAVPGEEQYLLAAGGYVGRQIGVMAYGKAVERLGYSVGVFNGEGANEREVSGTKAYAARVTWDAGVLVLGADVSVQPAPADSSDPELTGAVWGVDAEYGRFGSPGLNVVGEWMYGDDLALLADGAAPAMMGAQVVAGYFFPLRGRLLGYEPVLRASWGDPDLRQSSDTGVLLTPGLNLYLAEASRLMLNVDVYVPASSGRTAEYSVRAELQVCF